MEVKEFTDIPIADNSRHYRMSSGNHYVDFGVLDGELCAYLWGCPREGRMFLKALEEYAKRENLKLTVPTVLSPRLERILMDNGYSMKEVPYLGDICEVWSKDEQN